MHVSPWSHLIRNSHLTVESPRGTAKNLGLKLRADFGSWLQSGTNLDNQRPLTCPIWSSLQTPLGKDGTVLITKWLIF